MTVVHSHLVFSASGYLRSLGKDPVALAKSVGMSEAATTSGDVELSFEQLEQFFDRAAELTGDPHFGLSVARHRAPGRYGLLEFLFRTSSSLREAFECGSRYFSVLSVSSSMRVVRSGDFVDVVHTVASRPGGLGRHADVLILSGVIELVREMTGSNWSPREVWFIHRAPEDVATLERYFGTERLTFGRESNGFRFPASDLELEVLRSDPALANFLELQAREKAASRPAHDDLVAQVKEAIERELPDGAPNIERLAARFKLSARTLQRRLDEQGTTFAQLLEGLRQELAHRYVADKERPVGEIAFLLGYSDVSTFLRAFRRWTGKTPGEVREGR